MWAKYLEELILNRMGRNPRLHLGSTGFIYLKIRCWIHPGSWFAQQTEIFYDSVML